MKVALVAVNAHFIHKALAPWCLKAYCEERLPQVEFLVYETSINEQPRRVLEELYALKPDVIGFSCYIWNIEFVSRLCVLLRQVLPECVLLLGGPEVSYETDLSRFPFVDGIVAGTGEEALYQVIRELHGGCSLPVGVVKGRFNAFAAFPSPYTKDYFNSFYRFGKNQAPNQLIYYESSRGCPFCCAYCLSSAEQGVRYLPLERVYQELTLLMEHGARCIKFVDRTFNSNQAHAKAILQWIARLPDGPCFHFEVAADLFDEEMLAIIAGMPKARVQFEAGIQSVNPQVLDDVQRQTNLNKVFGNLERLIGFGNCHVHVDLIAGLPGEEVDSILHGVNRCLALRPHMLQLGFLKLLKGSRLREEADLLGLKAETYPPYEVLGNFCLSFEQLTRLKGVEEAVDKFYNTGMYRASLEYGFTLFSKPSDFLEGLIHYCHSHGGAKLSLQHSYAMMLGFLLQSGAQRERAEHVVKLDCLTFDPKGRLPDGVQARPAKEEKQAFLREFQGKVQRVRAEYFPYDQSVRIFVYDTTDPITREAFCRVLHKQ